MKTILIHGDETPVQETSSVCFMYFTAIDWEEVKKAGLVIIVAELKNYKRSARSFYGFEILKLLRIKNKLLNPVLLLSTQPKSFFLKAGKKDFNILRTPGHYLASSPYQLEQLCRQKYDGLDVNTLHDITRNILAFEGAIQEELHSLKNSIYALEDASSQKVKSLDAVQNLSSKYLGNIGSILEISKDPKYVALTATILNELKIQFQQENTADHLIDVISAYTKKLNSFLPESDEIDISSKTIVRPWEALYVEDTLKIAQDIVAKLKIKGVKCRTAKNAKDAFSILKADHANKITVLICDYRLLEEVDGFEVWQKKQGYNILEEAYTKLNNFIALFFLTFFNTSTLLRIQDTHKMKVWSYTKEDILHSNPKFSAFANRIIEEGNKYHDLICSQPTSKVWTDGYLTKFNRPFKDYYRMHRLALDFETAEQDISSKAEQFCRYIMEEKKGNKPSGRLPDYGFRDGIGNEKGASINKQEEVNRFRVKLIGRRIAIFLLSFLEMERTQIFSTMNFKKYISSTKSQSGVNPFFATFLALGRGDIPNHLLPEEKNWLKTFSEQLIQANKSGSSSV